MNIGSVMKEENIDKRNHDLKRAFNFSSPLIDIDGFEREAIVTLINITQKISMDRDVLSETLAKKLARNEQHLQLCLSSLEFLQTHNLKYPNSRCFGVIRAFEKKRSQNYKLGEDFETENVIFDWSHNAGNINHCLLFGAAFQLKGKVTSLANEVASDNKNIKRILCGLGINNSFLDEVGQNFIKIQENEFPSTVDNPHIKQVRIKSANGQFIAVTPLTSYITQKNIHIACRAHKFRTTVVKHKHPASVGGLTSATGGKVCVLYYPINKCKRSLNIIIGYRHFLDGAEWKVFLEYIEKNNYVRTDRQKKESETRFKFALNKLLFNWLSEQVHSHQEPTLLSHQFHHWLAKIDLGHQLSYHPQFLQPVYSGIKRLLNQQLSDKEQQNEYQYIILPHLKVSFANAMACSALCGLPSLNAFDGFITNFLLRLEAIDNFSVVHRSFALCVHDFDINKTSISREVYKKTNSIVRPGILDDRFCHFTVSIIVQARIEKMVEQKHLLAALPSRMAGGAVHLAICKEPQLKISPSMKESVQLISDGNQGCWIVDDNNYPQKRLHNPELSQCSEYLSKHRNSMPIVSGMKLLEKPTVRQGAVDDYLHAFSEQIISIAQQSSKIQDKSVYSLFWMRKWENDITYFSNIDMEK